MTRAEIGRKFDEIVAFAEVEKFLDTPVKRYSSGMYVRLAFAIAAHLDPEILVVDEVLAVGDAEFQKKCLGRMSEVAGAGRTVLFVSHNMGALSRLCTKALLLVDGRVVTSGVPADVIERSVSHNATTTSFRRTPRKSSKPMLVGAYCMPPDYAESPQSAMDIELRISSQEAINITVDLRLKDHYSNPVGFGSVGALEAKRPVSIRAGMNKVLLTISTDYLTVGGYFLSLDLNNLSIEYYDRAEDYLHFAVPPKPHAPDYFQQRWGYGSTFIPLSFRSAPESPQEHSVESVVIGP
jgi:lipopolysaccharide transport system ATP-binding protein